MRHVNVANAVTAIDYGGEVSPARLVGRQRDLSTLEAGLDEALASRGHLYLLNGEPGIGKTRLLQELSVLAAARGALPLWGRCSQSADAPPYWLWVQVLREILERREPRAPTVDPETAQQVARLVPEADAHLLGGSPGSLLRSTETHPSQLDRLGLQRFEMFEGVAAFFLSWTRWRPLVLLLDDLHAADAPSLLLLRFIARDLRDAQLLIVGAYREPEARNGGLLAEHIEELARDSTAIPLRGLDVAGVRELTNALVGRQTSERLANTLHSATSGNPFFLNEVVRLLVAEGRLDAVECAPGRIGVPERVRATVRARLVPLMSATRDVLDAAAVIGQEFDPELLAAVLRKTTKNVLTALSPALENTFVQIVASGGFRFSHGLIRETIYEEMSAARRVGLHCRTGRALEARHGNHAEVVLPALAHHFLQGQPECDAARAIFYARCAGEQALDLCAYEDAATYFEQALGLLDRTGGAGDAERCDVLIALARARLRAGQPDGARQAVAAAVAEARRLRLAPMLAEAALTFRVVIESTIVDPERVALREEALAAVGESHPSLRALLLAQLACELHCTEDALRRDLLSREAVSLARRFAEPATLASVLASRCVAVWGLPSQEERVPLVSEVLELAQQLGDRELMMEAHSARVIDSLASCDLAGVDREITIASQLAERLRQPYYRWRCLVWQAMRAGLTGRLAEAERLATLAYEVGQRVEPLYAANTLNAQVWMLLWLRGESDNLLPMMEAFRNQYETVRPEIRITIAAALAAAGRLDEARRDFESLAARDFDLSTVATRYWLSCVAQLSETCAAISDAQRARTLYELMQTYNGRAVVLGTAHACFGPADRYLGLLAGVLEDWDAAEAHFATSLRLAHRLNSTPYIAMTQRDHAAMLIARGRAEDKTRAEAMLAGALATNQIVGMRRVAEDLARLRSQLDAAAPSAAPRQQRTNLFRKEGEYWTIAYEGTTFHLKDLKGLHYVAQLLRHCGTEFHALDLVNGGSRLDDAVTGDYGALLDWRAKADYRQRLSQLHEELEEAQQCDDEIRSERVRLEIDALQSHLAAGVGLGGRDRPAGSDAERARLTVTKGIKTAIERIRENHAALADHLATTIRTGYFCSYAASANPPITWIL